MSALNKTALEQDPRAYVKDIDVWELEQQQVKKAQAGRGLLHAAFGGRQKSGEDFNPTPVQDRQSSRYYGESLWKLEQTVRLNEQEFIRLKRRLPVLELRSVELAVELLNSGRAVCRDGVCLVLDDAPSLQLPFLLYRIGTEKKVFSFLLKEVGIQDSRERSFVATSSYQRSGAYPPSSYQRSSAFQQPPPSHQRSSAYQPPSSYQQSSAYPTASSYQQSSAYQPSQGQSRYTPRPASALSAPPPQSCAAGGPQVAQVPTGRPRQSRVNGSQGYGPGPDRPVVQTAIIGPLVVGKWTLVQGSEMSVFETEAEALEKFGYNKAKPRVLFDPLGKEVAKGHNPVGLKGLREKYKRKRNDQLARECVCGRTFGDDENHCQTCSRLRPLRSEWLDSKDSVAPSHIEASQLGAYGSHISSF